MKVSQRKLGTKKLTSLPQMVEGFQKLGVDDILRTQEKKQSPLIPKGMCGWRQRSSNPPTKKYGY